MRLLKISSDKLVQKLLGLPKEHRICILDSCGVSNLGSHLLICGINPIETFEFTNEDPNSILKFLDKTVKSRNLASIFTLSYDFGLKINRIKSRFVSKHEPDLFIANFDNLIVHDYGSNETKILGNPAKQEEIEDLLLSESIELPELVYKTNIVSSETETSYIDKICEIQESIRSGDTYQVNLTQKFKAHLPQGFTPQMIYSSLKKNNPTPFSAFITRENDYVISTSPERFFQFKKGRISVSPIKGTRPRGACEAEDDELKSELISSEKDRAENVMIVDLMRNDLGRICKFGSINVDKLCELETHPSLFHLVSTVSGELEDEVTFSKSLQSLFPCGSITGCPKIKTMAIIDEIETGSRGLSMGAIGYSDFDGSIDMSVAIRTMVVRDDVAEFNVGGGIVIDSDPKAEFEESLIKANALITALNGKMG